jgi:hypothetical protein
MDFPVAFAVAGVLNLTTGLFDLRLPRGALAGIDGGGSRRADPSPGATPISAFAP